MSAFPEIPNKNPVIGWSLLGSTHVMRQNACIHFWKVLMVCSFLQHRQLISSWHFVLAVFKMSSATLQSQRCSLRPANGQNTMATQPLDGSLKDYVLFGIVPLWSLHLCGRVKGRAFAYECVWNREAKALLILWLWTPTDLLMQAVLPRTRNVISIRADFLSGPDKGVDISTPHSEWGDHWNVSYLTHTHALVDGR